MHFPLDALALAALGSPLPLWAAGRSENCSLQSWGTEWGHAGKRGSRVYTSAWWWRYCSALRLMGNTEEGMKKMLGFLGGVSCSAGQQGSRPCTVLSFLQILFNSRKEASSFWRAGCSCVLWGRLLTMSHSTRTHWVHLFSCSPAGAAHGNYRVWWFSFCGLLVEILCCLINHKHRQKSDEECH